MKIENIKILELKEYEKKLRKDKKAIEKVRESIRRFGFKVPVLIDSDNTIVSGTVRVKAAKLEGMLDLPCIRIDDLTEEQIKAFRIVENKSHEFAEWNDDILKIELAALSDVGITLSEWNFFIDEEIPQGDNYDIEESMLFAKNRVMRGDVWQLGDHRLMCGDSTIFSDVQKLMQEEKANLFLTDPPYNVNYTGKNEKQLKIEGDNQKDDDFLVFLKKAFSAAVNVMRPGAAFYIWHADSEGLLFRQAVKDAGLTLKQNLIWIKNTIVVCWQDYQWQHEPCLYGWLEGGSHYFFDKRNESTIVKDDELKTSVLREDRPTKNDEHPTMKPVELFGRLMRNSSIKENVVLDLFGGSGTTIIAAEKLGRNARVMEIDDRYCDVILDRWEKATGKEAKLIDRKE